MARHPVLSVRPLGEQEERELLRLIRCGVDAQAVRRARVVRLSARGMPSRRIAGLLGRCWSGVRKVINRFDDGGMASLADEPRQGRPRKATRRYVALLAEAVQRDPRDLGYRFGCSTLERLREHLSRRTRIAPSPARLSRLMRENGMVYRRPKHGVSHLRDPREYDQKKAFLAFVKRGRRDRVPASTSCTSTSVRFTSTRP